VNRSAEEVWSESASRAMPKSVSTHEVGSSSTFCGLTSRCSTPRPWAKERASASTSPMRTTSSGGSGPCALSRSCSVPPSWKSMTMAGRPDAVVPVASTVTMLGCWRPRSTVIWTSRANRAARSGSSAESISSTLMATSRSTETWRAR
jgi:hypothetical protein